MTNVLQHMPSPTKFREELERMVLLDLLGSVGGSEEGVDEPSVRDCYLVGMLAPKRQELAPEEFDELPQGGPARSRRVPPRVRRPPTRPCSPRRSG
jgi:hypothetical protein